MKIVFVFVSRNRICLWVGGALSYSRSIVLSLQTEKENTDRSIHKQRLASNVLLKQRNIKLSNFHNNLQQQQPLPSPLNL